MKDYLRRHIWILSELYQNPKGLTYKEFAEEWERTTLNSQQTPLPKRTFQDCLRAIEETFGIGYRVRGSKNGGVYPTVTGSLVTVNPGFTLPKLPADSYEEGSVRNIPHNLMKYSETPL